MNAFLILLIGAQFVVCSCGQLSRFNQLVHKSSPLTPNEVWREYIESDPDSARAFVDPRFFSNIYNSLPPKTELVKALRVDSTDEFESYAKLNLSITLGSDSFHNWLSFKKAQNGAWQLTLDEVPVLNNLTTGWRVLTIGNIRYHTSENFPLEWQARATDLNVVYDNYAKKFGYNPGVVDYFIARTDEEADLVVGEKDRGSGQARYKAIKAFDTPTHRHELVHVFAFELGAINPFFDEGLATALGNENLLVTKEVCDDVKNLLRDGFEPYLDASKFRTLQRQHRNVYAVAQQVVAFWMEKYGFDSIKEALREGTKEPFFVKKILANKFGSFNDSNSRVSSRVAEFCRRYK